jgi:hypothetical protein
VHVPDSDQSGQPGLPGLAFLRAASEEVLDRARAVADVVLQTGQGALGAAPVPRAVSELLTSVTHLVSQVPTPAAQLDLFLQELTAKRAMVAAMQAQLASFDSQLEILERSLQPLQDWSRQLSSAQEALLAATRLLQHPSGKGNGTPGG